MLLTLLISVLWQISHGYKFYETLTHASLEHVPVTLGQDVEIRCVKVLKSATGFYYSGSLRTEYAYCADYKDTCNHQWLKDGKMLKNGTKYELIRKITYGYCENFNTSKEMLYSIPGMSHLIEKSYLKYDYYDKSTGGVCLNSILRIQNVQMSDLGMYSCNYSDHDNSSYYRRHDYEQVGVDPIRNISLVNVSTFSGQPHKLQFYERYYMYKLRSVVYLDCVVTGGPVYWYIELFAEESYNNNPHVDRRIMRIGELDKLHDMWRCFNYTIKTMSPLHNVTESILFIENICPVDNVGVYCTSDENGGNPDNNTKEYRSLSDLHYEKYQDYDDEIVPALAISLPLISVLFIVAVIIGIARANCCGSSNMNAVYPVLRTY